MWNVFNLKLWPLNSNSLNNNFYVTVKFLNGISNLTKTLWKDPFPKDLIIWVDKICVTEGISLKIKQNRKGIQMFDSPNSFCKKSFNYLSNTWIKKSELLNAKLRISIFTIKITLKLPIIFMKIRDIKFCEYLKTCQNTKD